MSVDVPDMKGRVEILKVHAKNKKLDTDVDLEEIAARTPGFSGADLANLLNEVRPSLSPFGNSPCKFERHVFSQAGFSCL